MTTSRSHWPLSVLGSAVSLVNLFLPLVLVRILSPEDVGQYKIFFLYLVLVPWICLTGGVTNGLGHWAGHAEFRQKAFRLSWTLLVAVAIFALVVGSALHGVIGGALKWGETEAWLFVAGAFVTILAGFFDEASVVSGQIWRSALFTSGFELLRTVSILISALVFRSIQAVFVAHLAGMSAKLAVGVILGYRDGFQRLYWDREVAMRVLRYAVPVSLSAALTVFSSYSDQFILAQRLSSADFAVYSLGCLLVPPLLIFEQSVNRVLIPKMSTEFSNGNSHAACSFFRDAVSELSWLLIPSALGMVLFADPIVELLFTSRYAAAAPFLRIFALNHLVNLLPYDSVPRARGEGRWILGQLSFFTVLSLVGIIATISPFGAMGVLISQTVVAFLMRWNGIVHLNRSLGWTWKAMLPWFDWSVYIGISAICVAVSWSLKSWLGGGLLWFFVGGGIFFILYSAGTLTVFLRRQTGGESMPRLVVQIQQRMKNSQA